ncbi:3-hydroxyacyl-CoA dehydrogenase family protein [Flavihumibacter petaseus]|uniref:3-hydroxyacyl-CoA dehydrogenase C-terminal domain-containing protein n=1 Tax=Flavihumibacter petaseus NBRC 106054 TaxID=1220578 RepID=A0A0E9N7G0_9BACT|nr:3-hydroxyacyl-CoA dehydrogenase family protein [Flavihumibacter petaseus]GAO45290.1 hypothetical protein FPE01S_04_05340 [Flavihumibacter petaseus NBRC 106054]
MSSPQINVAICCPSGQELLVANDPALVNIHYHHDLEHFLQASADIYIDADFRFETSRMEALARKTPAIIMVNEVIHTCAELPQGFIRYNGWNGFSSQPLLECASASGQLPDPVVRAAENCGWCWKMVPDQPGLVRPRIISMIINEAFLAAEEGVSHTTEIDVAMRCGTNYPFGPFEWAEKIGLRNVYTLLKQMAAGNPRYQPASGLSGVIANHSTN